MNSSFKVLYTKDTLKKRKAYQDGKFSVRKTVNDSCQFVLLDENDKEVKRVTDKSTKFKVEIGTEFTFGAFGVQVEELIDAVETESTESGTTVVQQRTAPSVLPPAKKMFSKFIVKSSLTPSVAANISVSYPTHTSLVVGSISHPRKPMQQVHEAVLDPSLAKVMRPHQISGANFLLQRLSGTLTDTESGSNSSDTVCRGAILADEVTIFVRQATQSH